MAEADVNSLIVAVRNSTQHEGNEMATRTRTVKTSADLKKEIEVAKAQLAALEKRAYAEELSELIENTGIVKAFEAIKSKTKDIPELVILAAIGEAIGIKRLVVSQTDIVPRKPRPKKTEVQ